MNSYFICASILLLCFGSTIAENCTCTTFLMGEDGFTRDTKTMSFVFDIENTNCDFDLTLKCQRACINKLSLLSDWGKLCSVIQGGQKKVGDLMCEAINRDVCNRQIGLMLKDCGSGFPFVDSGYRFEDEICCKSGKNTNC
ncbi:uncharacterized protein [Parasteatoda tepidariorum]|uniref:uncharacterized protein n=1 Tax=Parasteatoda tepidariorum TaxID=114398 RepID=UPI00077FBC1F|nr:uncharacterized protein LOC107451584 [Parasteatoda tepidariorum]